MADKPLESGDPFERVGVTAPVEGGGDPDEVMVRCFVEEYALLGVPRDKILYLFQRDVFSGTHRIYQERGEAFVERIIDQVFNPRSASGTPEQGEG